MRKIIREYLDLLKTKPDNYFDTEHLKIHLKGRSVRGGAVTLISQIIKFLLQTGSTVALARLLTPHDYGLIAMVTAITGFISMFQDIGLSTATIQNAKINHAQVSTLFWINLAVSFVFALIIALCAPIISWFYSEPRLTWIAIILSATFLLSGMTVQHQALLKRQMRFIAIATIEIGSISLGIITGIIMGCYGARYWALVGLSVVVAFSRMILVWVLCTWRPSLPTRKPEIYSFVEFGVHITGFDIVNYFARNFDKMLLGRYRGSIVLGLYDKAYNIMMLPISQIGVPLSIVALPALSNIQYEPIRFKSYYLKLVGMLAFITMPLMAFLFVSANQVIYLLLGSQWLGATDIFRILCINAFIQPLAGTTRLVLISLGQTKRYFTIGAINSMIIVAFFVLGLPWGAIGVATAYTVATYIILVPTLWFSFRLSPISILDFFSAISRPMIASMFMAIIIIAVRSFLLIDSNIVYLSGLFFLGSIAYFIMLLVIPGGVHILRELKSFRTILFQKSA